MILICLCNFKILIDYHCRQVKFQNSVPISSATKRVAEEEIIEVEDLAKRQYKQNENNDQPSGSTVHTFKKPQISKPNTATKSSLVKSSLVNLVKRKTPTATQVSTPNTSQPKEPIKVAVTQPTTANALSLLSGYDDSDSNESD